MNTRIYGLLSGLLMLAGGVLNAGECCPHCRCQVPCCYKEVIVQRCKLVPEMKPIKKTIYDCRCIPFCIPKMPCQCYCDHCKAGHCGQCTQGCQCGGCVGCQGLVKKVLLKKEITIGEICTYKCVLEDVVELVPVPCCHCGQLCTQAPQRLLGAPVVPAAPTLGAPQPIVDGPR